ncbi:AraC family transcriptional regulator [Thiolinea disciformis]|uniref:AraC family transcriptional regulator n=1 Tax=Thiolinea disciformis TaxID=125614 RepID=UPI00036C2D16|nr:helix-turn-helix domain-containing protein [Thiolinea disciformis]
MATLLTSLALLLCGYALFSAVVLGLTEFRLHNTNPVPTVLAGWVLLIALAGLQLSHFAYLASERDWIHSAPYRMLLFTVAPAFYFFSRPLLQANHQLSPRQSLHILPILSAAFMPYAWALPLAFAVGAGYLLWLAKTIYALRAQRSQFQWELMILGGVFALALGVMLLGLALPLLSEPLFFSLYASAIGFAFVLVNLALSRAPQLSSQVEEAARATYANSTLNHVDHNAALQRLDQVMKEQQVFQSPDFGLDHLAQHLQLSSHQTSELINVHLGKGFSRLVREYRIEAAKAMLIAEPSASVLSVGLSVGFTSQSNFYEAFREITGTTPAQYRKLNASNQT